MNTLEQENQKLKEKLFDTERIAYRRTEDVIKLKAENEELKKIHDGCTSILLERDVLQQESKQAIEIVKRLEDWYKQIKNNENKYDELLKTKSKVHGIWLSDKLQSILQGDKN